MTQEIRAALIGAGNIGRHHARVLSSLAGVCFTAVCDSDPKRAQDAGEQYHVPWFTDATDMLDRVKPHAVVIATPTSTHCTIAGLCIDRDIPVLVEKPISASLEESGLLAQRAADRGVTIAVGHTERFNPAVIAMKRIIDEGLLGDPLMIHARRLGMKKPFNPQKNVITELGIHDIEACSFLMGREQPVTCTHAWSKRRNDDAIHVARVHLDSPAVSSVIDLSWESSFKLRTLTVAGTKAHAQLNYVNQHLVLSENEFEKKDAQAMAGTFSDFLLAFGNADMRDVPVEKQEPLKIQMQDFFDSIEENRPPMVPIDRAIETLALAYEATRKVGG